MTEGQHPIPQAVPDASGADFWQACIDQMAQELPEQQFQTWIKPLSAQVADDLGKVTIFVANRFKMDWIRAQYSHRLALIMERLTGQAVQIELALAVREPVVRKPEPKTASPAVLLETLAEADHFRPAEPLKSRLNTSLTFDALVEGSANRMARAAAMHVAGMPGHLYNPLFIYGGVGLGKTHLMHAL